MTSYAVGTTTVYVIGKCPIKGCKNRRRVTVEDAAIIRRGVYTYTDWKIPAPAPYGAVPGHLSDGSDRHYGPRPERYLASNPYAYEQAWFAAVDAAGWICRDHNRFMVTTEVRGVINAEKPCNGKCKAATGPNCECVCGGEGHGSNYGG